MATHKLSYTGAQIDAAIKKALEAVGIYVQSTEPTESKEGDLWIDTSAGAGSNTYATEQYVQDYVDNALSGISSTLDEINGEVI